MGVERLAYTVALVHFTYVVILNALPLPLLTCDMQQGRLTRLICWTAHTRSLDSRPKISVENIRDYDATIMAADSRILSKITSVQSLMMLFPCSAWSPRRRFVTLSIAAVIVILLCRSWSLAQFTPIRHHLAPALGTPTFPKKIWYKLGPKGISDQVRNWTDTCIEQNHEYTAVFLTDAAADNWVRVSYAFRPDIVETYLNLSVPILKADFLRYLLLFAEGGIWFDLDVSCEVPVDEWIPPQYESNISLLVGWEFDVGWGENVIHQLNSWMIMAKPELPHMMMAIEDILQGLNDVCENNGVTIADVTLPMVGDVVDFTGPRRLTRSVYKSLQETLNATDAEFERLERSTWFIREPKVLGDVLILPGFSFASSMNTYNEMDIVGPPLVRHHYLGSWKNDHGGET